VGSSKFRQRIRIVSPLLVLTIEKSVEEVGCGYLLDDAGFAARAP
jgi:hypothetical protein